MRGSSAYSLPEARRPQLAAEQLEAGGAGRAAPACANTGGGRGIFLAPGIARDRVRPVSPSVPSAMRSQIILLAMGALYCSACSSRAGLRRPVLAGSHQPAGARIALNLHTSAARAAHPVLVEKTRVASRRASIGALGAMLAAGDGARPVLAGDPPWPYSTLIDEIGNGFVSSVQISAEAKQALVVDKVLHARALPAPRLPSLSPSCTATHAPSRATSRRRPSPSRRPPLYLGRL